MQSSLYVSPADETGGQGGGGPDDPTRVARFVIRSQGFLMLAFGIALGLTCMVFFEVFHILRESEFIKPFTGLQEFIKELNPNIWLSFAFGFVGGTVLSGIYNILVVRRLNLFGLESSRD